MINIYKYIYIYIFMIYVCMYIVMFFCFFFSFACSQCTEIFLSFILPVEAESKPHCCCCCKDVDLCQCL